MKSNKIALLITFTGLIFLSGCKEMPKSNKKDATVESPSKNYTEIGLKYAKSTQAELGKNLMRAIQKEGTLEALEFCNVQAYPLTDSMATVHNARLKRVSDKPRNPKNQANEKELKHISYFKDLVATGEEYQPIVEEENGTVNFYYPITTNAMCLQCHGKPNEQIQPETLTALKNLYPADKAIGYTENEVRGLWSIHFAENTAN